MFDDSDRDRLDSLAKRIQAARRSASPEREDMDDATSQKKRATVEAIRVGSDFVALVVLSGALGWWLDRQFDVAPLWMLTLLLLGFVFGFAYLYFFLTRKSKTDE